LNILLLDDNEHRIQFFKNGLKQHKLTVCRHAKGAIKALGRSSFDIIFLDHDLVGEPADPDEENCGSEVARFLVEQDEQRRTIILHTENAIGRSAMEAILGDQCQSIPYSKLKKVGFHAVLKSLKTQT
jgi:CheY-like chemotaxis protein